MGHITEIAKTSLTIKIVISITTRLFSNNLGTHRCFVWGSLVFTISGPLNFQIRRKYTRRNATIQFKLKDANQWLFCHLTVEWMAGAFQRPFSDYSVPFGHQSWTFILVRFRHFYYISNWYIVFNSARTAKGENTFSATKTYVLICLWILCSFRKLFTLREQRKHLSIYTSPVDNTRVSKYSCVTFVNSLSFQKAFNSRERRHRQILLYRRLK